MYSDFLIFSAEHWMFGPTCINEEMKLAAVYALAGLAKAAVPESVSKAYNVMNLVFGKDYIIPKPLDPRLITTIAPSRRQSRYGKRSCPQANY